MNRVKLVHFKRTTKGTLVIFSNCVLGAAEQTANLLLWLPSSY